MDRRNFLKLLPLSLFAITISKNPVDNEKIGYLHAEQSISKHYHVYNADTDELLQGVKWADDRAGIYAQYDKDYLLKIKYGNIKFKRIT